MSRTSGSAATRAAVTAAVTAAVATVVTGAAPGAAADPAAGVDSQLWRPSWDASGTFSLDGAQTMPRYDLAFKLGLGYGHDPFRVAVPGIGDDGDGGDGAGGADSVLAFNVGLHMTLAFAFTDRLTFGIDTGLYRTDTGAGYGQRGRFAGAASTPSTGLISLRPLSNIDPSGGFEDQGLSGPFDTRLGLKFQLLRGRVGVAVIGSASAPFGDEEMFLGDAGFVFEPRVAVDVALSDDRASALVVNAAARLRRRTVLEAFDPATTDAGGAAAVFDLGSEVMVGAGARWALTRRVTAAAEAVAFAPLPAGASYGSCRLADGTPCSAIDDDRYFDGAGYGDVAAYAMAGATVRASAQTAIAIAAGAGLAGDRREAFRVVTGVVWTPSPPDDDERAGRDRDGDGVADHLDVCPDDAEDRDGFQDDDGCPERDNDEDGVPDGDDGCPSEPEDRDGYQDDDGCPEANNDGDAIPDLTDRCPGEVEDEDGFEDDDGCPDPDNDGDGVDDASDACPNAPETVNGVDDGDGCPDARTATVPIEDADRIRLRGNQIAFDGRTAELTAEAELILRDVGALIVQRGLQIRVEVHTARGTRSRSRRANARAKRQDLALAQRRAEAIARFLTAEAGVPQGAVEAAGIGSEQPAVAPAHAPANDRVDFLKRAQEAP